MEENYYPTYRQDQQHVSQTHFQILTTEKDNKTTKWERGREREREYVNCNRDSESSS